MTETQSPQTPATPDKRRVRPALLICAGAVIGAVVAVAAVVLATTGIHFGSEKTGPSLRATAIQKCESAVRDQLKSPGSAKFSGVQNAPEDPYAEPDENTTYKSFDLVGNVDSQNSFGALMRSTWTCTVGYYPRDKAWTSASADVTQE